MRRRSEPAQAEPSLSSKLASTSLGAGSARRSGGTCFVAASTKQVPRLRRPSGDFARDDGKSGYMRLPCLLGGEELEGCAPVIVLYLKGR